MKSLYSIVKELQEAQGTINKQAIMDANKEHPLFHAYMKAVYDPAINYYQKALPKGLEKWTGTEEFNFGDIAWMIDNLAARKLTGRAASGGLNGHASALLPGGRELLGYMLKHSIGGSVGDAMVLKTFPGLYFIPPYMRCASMSEKMVAHYRTKRRFYVQPKRDGSFAYLVKDDQGACRAITRAGTIYPKWFAERMLRGIPGSSVLIGEMEVYQRAEDNCANWELLDRKTGNGILNSIAKGEDEKEFSEYNFKHIAWDMLDPDEFKIGKSDREYVNRLLELDEMLRDAGSVSVELIETEEVTSVEEAFAINTDLTARGLEGSVWKTMDGPWRDSGGGTKDCVKLKVVFHADYEIESVYEGEGKLVGMLGGFNVKTSCGGLKSGCGSGVSDDDRKYLWKIKEQLPGMIVELKANDVVTKRGSDVVSLNLPIFVELRSDKKEADSLERVYEQRDAARLGG